jgi:hypothetical protein
MFIFFPSLFKIKLSWTEEAELGLISVLFVCTSRETRTPHSAKIMSHWAGGKQTMPLIANTQFVFIIVFIYLVKKKNWTTNWQIWTQYEKKFNSIFISFCAFFFIFHSEHFFTLFMNQISRRPLFHQSSDFVLLRYQWKQSLYFAS